MKKSKKLRRKAHSSPEKAGKDFSHGFWEELGKKSADALWHIVEIFLIYHLLHMTGGPALSVPKAQNEPTYTMEQSLEDFQCL